MNLLLLVLNGSLIAGIYAFAKAAAADGVSALGMLAWQLLFAAPTISLAALWRGQWPRPTTAQWRYAAIAGALGISAPNLVTFAALSHVPAGLIGVIGALSPLFTYAIALALRAETARPLRAAGIVLGLAGVLVVLWPQAGLSGAHALPWALAALAGPLLLAGGNLFRTLAWPPGLPPLAAASLMLTLQALWVVPAALALGAFEAPQAPWLGGDAALLGGGVLTALFYLTAFELQRRAGPVMVGQLGYVITVASLLLGVLVFGERYPASTLLGAAIVLGGVMLVHRGGAAAPLAAREGGAP